MKARANKIKYCFQQEKDNVHKLYIYDDVTAKTFNWSTWEYEDSETSAKHFRDQLEAIPNEDTIELHINSNGGSVKEGVAIYNLLKQKACKKIGHVDGVAYSIAFVILQACDTRIMGIGTSALIHEIWIEACGNAKELRKIAEDLDVLMEANRKIFLESSNLEEQQLIEMMEAETFLTPDQCLEYGLIDEIGTYRVDEGSNEEIQEGLKNQLEKLKELVQEQKEFQVQLALMHQSVNGIPGKDPEPEPKPEKKLTNQLFNIFKNM